jgi:hypothetical protein
MTEDAPASDFPEPPAEGWTLQDAAQALTPKHWAIYQSAVENHAEADRHAPSDGWMSGGRRGAEAQRDHVRRMQAFAKEREKARSELVSELKRVVTDGMVSGRYTVVTRIGSLSAPRRAIESDQWRALVEFDFRASSAVGPARNGAMFLAICIKGASPSEAKIDAAALEHNDERQKEPSQESIAYAEFLEIFTDKSKISYEFKEIEPEIRTRLTNKYPGRGWENPKKIHTIEKAWKKARKYKWAELNSLPSN